MADEPQRRPPGGAADASDRSEKLSLEDLEEVSLPTVRSSPPRIAPPQLSIARAVGTPPTPKTSHVRSSPTSAPSSGGSRLAMLCRAQLEGERDPARKARLHYELGRHHERAGDWRRAAEHYREAFTHAADLVAAIHGARRAHVALGEHAALPALFDAEIAVTGEPGTRARLLVEKARLYETKLGQPAEALSTYRAALALDPANISILKGIERGHRRDDDPGALAETYLELSNAAPDAPLRAAWMAMAARLTQTRLGDPARAASLYESALSVDPHATPSLAHVKRLGATHGRWHSLITALRKEHELCRDPDARLGILRAIAHVEEVELKDLRAATATIDDALQVHPEDRSLLRERVRLDIARGEAPVSALARLAELAEDDEERAALSYRIGTLFEQELHDLGRARPWYERALSADGAHAAAALALIRIYEAEECWSELLRVLATRAHAILDPAERAGLFHRMGLLLEEKLGRCDDAIAQHAYALGLDPAHHQAFRALERLHTANGAWRELVDLYGWAIDRAAHDAEAIAWLFRVGGVLEDRLGDLDGALAAYTRILERDPRNLGALHALARTAERAGRVDRLLWALRTEAELTEDPARRDALLHRAALLTADALGDLPGAILALEEILRRTPQHRASLDSLAELAIKAGQWTKAVAVHSRILPLLVTAKERARLHHRNGEIQAEQLGDDAAAIVSFSRALEFDPDFEPAREARIAALERRGDHAALAEALEERIGRLRDPVERAVAATRLGRLYEERLGDRTRALASYELAIEAVPLHRPALDARERLLTEARDHARLQQALEAEAAQTTDEFERVQASLRAALTSTAQRGAAGLGAFRPVFSAQPGHVGALLAVEDTYLGIEDAAGLAATYERLVEALESTKAKLAVLEELAALGIEEEAADVRQRILSLAPDDAAALEARANWAMQRADRASELSLRTRLTTILSEPSVVAAHHCRIAELHLAQNDPTSALAAYRAACAADPANLGATEGLTRAARAARDPEGMREAARREAWVTRDRATAVALLREAGRIEYERGRENAAAACYEEALSLAPDDPEAASGVMATMMRGSMIVHLLDVLGRAAHAARDPSRAAALHLAIALFQADLLHDLSAAVLSARRALEACPRHLVALESLVTSSATRNGRMRSRRSSSS